MKIIYIAIYSNFEGINSLYKVKAENEFDAAKKALLLHAEKNESRTQDYDDWVNSFKDMDELLQQCINCDLSVSNSFES